MSFNLSSTTNLDIFEDFRGQSKHFGKVF